jgi:hypothetical protein
VPEIEPLRVERRGKARPDRNDLVGLLPGWVLAHCSISCSVHPDVKRQPLPMA